MVTGNHLVHHRHSGAGMFRNVCCLSWLHQCIIDDQPALSTPRTWVQFQSQFEFFCREMRSSSCDPGHGVLLEPVSPTWFLILSYFSLRSQLGIKRLPNTSILSAC